MYVGKLHIAEFKLAMMFTHYCMESIDQVDEAVVAMYG